MQILILLVCLSLGLSIQDQIPETESAFYSQVMLWLFIIFLLSLTK